MNSKIWKLKTRNTKRAEGCELTIHSFLYASHCLRLITASSSRDCSGSNVEIFQTSFSSSEKTSETRRLFSFPNKKLCFLFVSEVVALGFIDASFKRRGALLSISISISPAFSTNGIHEWKKWDESARGTLVPMWRSKDRKQFYNKNWEKKTTKKTLELTE